MRGADVYRGWQRLRDKAFTLALRRSFHSLGARTVVQLPVRLGGEQQIAIGDDVFVGAGSWLQTLGHPDSAEPQLVIGDGTSIAGQCVLSAARDIRVGRSVLFARNVYVADHRHAFGDGSRPVLEQGIEEVRPIDIGDGAWLGQNSVVCPGVTIGAGAVIAANSVVNLDIPGRCLAAGTPARVMRRFDDVAESPRDPGAFAEAARRYRPGAG